MDTLPRQQDNSTLAPPAALNGAWAGGAFRFLPAFDPVLRDGTPFDILSAQRTGLQLVCALIDILPGMTPPVVAAFGGCLASYLREDFPALLAEEEQGLLPRLHQRLLLGDDLDEILNHLVDEHRHDLAQARQLAAKCDELARGLLIDDKPTIFSALKAFAEQQRRHLAWEEATVFSLARQRLTRDDLSQWKRGMQAASRMLA